MSPRRKRTFQSAKTALNPSMSLLKTHHRLTGRALLDEDFLRAEGVTDFSGYACVPGTDPPRISWASSAT
jgi:hypothetical protein